MLRYSERYRLPFYLACISLTIFTFMLANTDLFVGTSATVAYAQQATPTPIILTPVVNFPVVADAPAAGFFDHKSAPTATPNKLVQLFDGRANPSTSAGFTFTCSSPTMNDWVGCTDNQSGESNCPDANELWYDEHAGTDFEYFPDWHTGATCNVNLHPSSTYEIPVFSASVGFVEDILSSPGNGYYYRIKSNANNLTTSDSDDVKVWYLHLRTETGKLNVGEFVNVGDLIAFGDMTGSASTPHLHLYVQRSVNSLQRPVDPFGWTGSGSDPYPVRNQSLWSYSGYAPLIYHTCSGVCPAQTN